MSFTQAIEFSRRLKLRPGNPLVVLISWAGACIRRKLGKRRLEARADLRKNGRKVIVDINTLSGKCQGRVIGFRHQLVKACLTTRLCGIFCNEVRHKLSMFLAFCWLIVVGLVGFAFLPKFSGGLSWISLANDYLSAIIPFSLYAAIFGWIDSRKAIISGKEESSSLIWGLILLPIVGVMVVLESYYSFFGLTRWDLRHIVPISIGLISLTVTLWFVLIIQNIITMAIDGFVRMKNANEYFNDCIFSALIHIARGERKWGTIKYRSSIIKQIEVAAVIAERYLFRPCTISSASLRSFRDQQGQKIAAGLRTMEPSLLTPSLDTREILIDRLSLILLSSLRGDWDTLVHLNMDEQTQSCSILGIIMPRLSFMAPVMLAFSPLCIIKGSIYFGIIAISPPVMENLYVGAVVLAVLIVVGSFKIVKEAMPVFKDIVAMSVSLGLKK